MRHIAAFRAEEASLATTWLETTCMHGSLTPESVIRESHGAPVELSLTSTRGSVLVVALGERLIESDL